MGTRLTLDVFGEGRCRKDLERLASSLNLTEEVRFHGFRPEVRQFLPAYRVYVHASYSEALPYAILEAMAAGLPIVAARAGVSPELFQDGVEGRLWPLDDPKRAAIVLLDLIYDEPRRSAAAAASLQQYENHFQSSVVGPDLYTFLTQSDHAGSPIPDGQSSCPWTTGQRNSEDSHPLSIAGGRSSDETIRRHQDEDNDRLRDIVWSSPGSSARLATGCDATDVRQSAVTQFNMAPRPDTVFRSPSRTHLLDDGPADDRLDRILSDRT